MTHGYVGRASPSPGTSEPLRLFTPVSAERQALLARLEAHFRSHGWKVQHGEEGLLEATGPGGVTWLGTAVLDEDLGQESFEARLAELAERRMPSGGELCPLDLVTATQSEHALRSLLERLALAEEPHVSLYSIAA